MDESLGSKEISKKCIGMALKNPNYATDLGSAGSPSQPVSVSCPSESQPPWPSCSEPASATTEPSWLGLHADSTDFMYIRPMYCACVITPWARRA